MDVAKNGNVKNSGGETAADLRASAAIACARIAGKESYDAFKAMVDNEKAAEGVFGMALDRMQVAKECGDNLACYGKTLTDPSWTRAEKAAFAIAFSGNSKQGLPLLLAALKPITALSQDRYPVHQAILFGLARLGSKDCTACIDKLTQQVEHDEKAVRLPGARDLLGETRVTEAIIQNQGPGDLAAAATVATAEGDSDAAPAGKAGKGSKKGAKVAKAAKGGGKKKHK
jgi:hypothetical protein